MDPVSLPVAVQPSPDVGTSLHTPYQPPSPPTPPPELVGRFEALMARAPAPAGADAGGSVIPQGAINAVDAHLKHHVEIIDRVAKVSTGEVSLADLQVIQMQSTVQLGMMAMTQAAYMQVLGSSKSSVSALMKNQ